MIWYSGGGEKKNGRQAERTSNMIYIQVFTGKEKTRDKNKNKNGAAVLYSSSPRTTAACGATNKNEYHFFYFSLLTAVVCFFRVKTIM